MIWMLVMVLAMPQGLTSNVLLFMDRAACREAQDEMNAAFKVIQLGKGGWIYLDCLPAASDGKKTRL